MKKTAKTNKPNGKSEQIFAFKGDEAKHAIGIQHLRRKQFESYPGIVQIELVDERGKPIQEKGKKCQAFKIVGEPKAVDEVMDRIDIWLKKCQKMKHQSKENMNNNSEDDQYPPFEEIEFYGPEDEAQLSFDDQCEPLHQKPKIVYGIDPEDISNFDDEFMQHFHLDSSDDDIKCEKCFDSVELCSCHYGDQYWQK